MLGLGHSISTTPDFEWGNSKFLAFDGVDDKAILTVDSAFTTSIAGEGNIGANIGFSFWIKPAWSTSGSYGTSGFAPRKIMFFYIGAPADNHESVQGYYQLTNSSGTAQNRLWSELRATTTSNTRDNDFSALHSNNGVTGVGTGSTNSWTSTNPSGGAWVHIVMTRATGNWTQYWNGQALSMIDSDSGTLNTDNSIGRVFNIGFKDTDDSFHKFGVRDFAIFTKQLDSDAATTLYNSGSFFDVRTSGISNLGVYYPFNEHVRDIVGGNNLALTGGTFTAL